MKKYLLKVFAAAILLITVLASCNKTAVDKSVHIDTYIHSIFNRAGVPVYSVLHSAYSFSKLSGVDVTGSAGKISLINFSDNGYSFYNQPDTAIYKTTVPVPDNYTYSVTYDTGETVAKPDATIAASLEPARNLSAVKTATEIQLSWNPIVNVEGYKVRIHIQDLTTQTKVLIYESDFLFPVNAISDLSINFPLTNFTSYLDKYLYFEVSGFIFQLNHDTYHAVSATTVKKYFGN